MNENLPATLRDQREKQTLFLEVVNAEKLLWTTIQHKGILHAEVQDLYRKARSGYEKIILSNYQADDLQDVEYSLWKLHYKHIDEYRKKIKKVSGSAESINNLNSHVERFKLFLSEVAEFYKDLIAKFKRTCGISEETLLFKNSGGSDYVEPTILQKYHYAWHRLLVCLGDVSRYMELCKKPNVQKWTVAAMNYFEATTVWPYSGNPQNQLALLAMYNGDDFLALYHFIRSLAIKEPFPDAPDNIMLLFEKNKSTQLQSLSTEVHIDFSKPLKRLSSQIKSQSSIDSTNINKLGANEHVHLAKIDLWPLFVRMISFFVVKPSFEDLPHTFASTMKELEELLALNDVELKSSLEPYEKFDSSRKGPYRAIQAVSILIFVIQNLIKTLEQEEQKGEKDKQLSSYIAWAWTCTFSCLGHFVQRCLLSNDQENCCSLLPSVLVFVEWYVGMLDYAENYGKDEKVGNAKSYFFGALVELLSGFDVKDHETTINSALWEDYELRGFDPVSQLNESLDFSHRSENRHKFEAGNSFRVNRIIRASIKIADRLKGSLDSPIFYDQSAKKFYTGKGPEKFSNKKDQQILDEESAIEEEEVILFKPLTRYNSEPIQTSNEPVDETENSEEGLNQSFSQHSAQNGSQDSPKQGPSYSAGPPSLSGWVHNGESLNLEKERESRNSKKQELPPILEIPTPSLADMPITEATYVSPVPSAPLLPEDPVWLRGSSVKEEHGILGALPVGRSSTFSSPQEPLDYSSGVPGFVDAYRPPVFGLSSSEWLYRYTNNLSLDGANGNIPNSNNHWPVFANIPSGNLGNFHGYDSGLRYDLIDGWGNPLLTNHMVYFENPNLVYGKDEKQRERVFFGYQRPIVGGHGGGGGGGGVGGAEIRAELPPHLQHLKEREWQLQSESPFRGHPYMGN